MKYILLIALAGLLMPTLARAQAFFGLGVSAFTPEISVLAIGTVTDVQATVSSDRKYVTLNMRPQNNELVGLYRFTFQNSQQFPTAAGIVGAVKFAEEGGTVLGLFGAVNPPIALDPGNGERILTQRGMTPVRIK